LLIVCFGQEEIRAIPQSAKQRAPAAFLACSGLLATAGAQETVAYKENALEHQFVPKGD